jgi:hypothetical protein
LAARYNFDKEERATVMTPKLTKFQSQTAALIQQIRLAPGIPTFWLPIKLRHGARRDRERF